MTSQAMYLRADVIGLLVEANIILPPTWKNLENYTKEMLTECEDGDVRADCLLHALSSVDVGGLQQCPEHLLGLGLVYSAGHDFHSIAFLFYLCKHHKYIIASPLLH